MTNAKTPEMIAENFKAAFDELVIACATEMGQRSNNLSDAPKPVLAQLGRLYRTRMIEAPVFDLVLEKAKEIKDAALEAELEKLREPVELLIQGQGRGDKSWRTITRFVGETEPGIEHGKAIAAKRGENFTVFRAVPA